MNVLGPAIILLLAISTTIHGQEAGSGPPRSLTDSSEAEALQAMEQLLQMKVLVASKFSQAPERAPSVVTVITRRDIDAYGPRDISEILRLVPGFEMGVDVVGIFAPSARGIWVHEGKALFMINGVTYNDFGNGNLNLVGAIPADMIDHIEIIRGPGSAVYGKFAEVAVVNILTRGTEATPGGRVDLGAGSLGGGSSSYNGNLSASGSLGPNAEVALTVGFLNGPHSRKTYRDFFGGSLLLDGDNSQRSWKHILAEVKAFGTQIRFQHFSLHYGAQDGFTTIVPKINGINTEEMNNYMDAVKVQHPFALGHGLRLEATLEYAKGNTVSSTTFPGNVNQGLFANSGQDMTRLNADLTATYESPVLQAFLGGGYGLDRARNVGADNTPGMRASAADGDYTVQRQVQSRYLYGQAARQGGDFGLTLGGRYEWTDLGNAFAPRAGLTWVHGAANAKLLYGKAYRIALPWQAFSRLFNYAGNVTAETGATTELELGYRFSRGLSGRMNLFRVAIHNPITYLGSTNSYQNFGDTLSKGLEAELRYDALAWGGFWNLSIAEPAKGTSPEFRNAEGDRLLGMVPLKMNVGLTWNMGWVRLAPSLTYLSGRDGQSAASAAAGPIGTTRYPALWLVNFTGTVRDFHRGTTLRLSAQNLGNSDYRLIQPYYGGHAPIPTYDRRLTLDLSWRF